MIRVQREDFDVGAEIAKVAAAGDDVGGVVSFVGVVRGGAGEEAIAAMTLEHYPGMTKRELERIETEALKRWPAVTASLIIHRYGRLEPGDRIVLVVTASRHRRDAFQACEFLVDWLKTQAPFWKSEEGKAGARWVQAQEGDDHAAARWSKNG